MNRKNLVFTDRIRHWAITKSKVADMARYIYIDTETGSWGSANTLYIVDYDELFDDQTDTLLEGTDREREYLAEELADKGIAVLLDAEATVNKNKIRH